ncbi:MAG: nucleoside recognition protein [Clostridia bacterium]|nr:nucleoside recognition protein [Clostridia bacterium]
MNLLFVTVFLISTFLLLCTSPETFLSALLDGAGKGATVSVSLIATYSVWLGLMRVWEDSGVARGISRLTKPVARKLFKTDDEETLQALSMNMSVNLLGISGAATPYGIKAAQLLDKTENAEYSSAMLFVLNATSLQVIPTSIIAVRVAMQSAAPNDIVIPTFLATLFSTFLAVTLTRIFIPPKKSAIEGERDFFHTPKTVKTREAGTR